MCRHAMLLLQTGLRLQTWRLSMQQLQGRILKLLRSGSERACGIFPKQARNACRAKADMKTETDKFKLAVLDGRQLALKVSANRCGCAYVEIRCSHLVVSS